jgi:hypothetical protein
MSQMALSAESICEVGFLAELVCVIQVGKEVTDQIEKVR